MGKRRRRKVGENVNGRDAKSLGLQAASQNFPVFSITSIPIINHCGPINSAYYLGQVRPLYVD